MVEVGPMPYWVMNTILDAGFPKGLRNYWLSSFTTGLPDGLIDTVVERYETVPSQGTILLEHFHGAVCRVGVTDTAVPHREPGWNLVLPTIWSDPAEDEANIAWTRETHAALGEFLSARRWLNYLADDQGDDAIRGAYGPNYDRLVESKAQLRPGERLPVEPQHHAVSRSSSMYSRRGLADRLEHGGIAATVVGSDVGDGELHPPFVAEVERVGDLEPRHELERVERIGVRASRLRDVPELPARVLRPGMVRMAVLRRVERPELAVQPERVEVRVIPAEGLLERKVEIGQRLVAPDGDSSLHARQTDKLGAEDVDLPVAAAAHPLPSVRGDPDGDATSAARSRRGD